MFHFLKKQIHLAPDEPSKCIHRIGHILKDESFVGVCRFT